MSELIIVFPPFSQAYFFPYLSLPMLTSYLVQRDVPCTQYDLNIELLHSLFEKEALQTYCEIASSKEHMDINADFKLKTIQYLIDHHEEIQTDILTKNGELHDIEKSLKFFKNGTEILSKNSFMRNEIPSISLLGKAVNDFNVEDKNDLPCDLLYDRIKNIITNDTKVFALSVSFYSQLLPALLLCKWVKILSPETKIIMGGQQVILFSEQMRRDSFFKQYVDYLGTGAGEETLYQLYLKESENQLDLEIPNLISLKEEIPLIKKSVSLKKLPVPNFDNLPIHHYVNADFQLALTTCVGCYWGRCAFCSYGNRSKKERSYEQKTTNQIVRECKQLIDQYGVRRINFVDENTNLKLVLKAMKLLNAEGYEVEYSTRNRLEDILTDRHFCQELKASGCVQMSVGYETNSQRLLDRMEKGVTTSNYQRIIDNLFDCGIELRLSIMGGFPGETEEESQDTVGFLKKNEMKIGIDVIQMLVAEPGSFLVDDPESYGITLEADQDTLRGNKGINYGMGRLGRSFTYCEEDIDDHTRINRLLQVPKEVNPEQNQLHTNDTDHLNTTEAFLLPWIYIAEFKRGSEDQSVPYFYDFLLQRVFKVPQELSIIDRRIVTDTSNPESEMLISQLIQLELVTHQSTGSREYVFR
ncbi:B12-binding domain-containing radical SAM protein [Fictibacillus norfolkensis]|uniref:Radical SAM protein n=1 Tax=Fictibacillus norfolkensis TaxID=2762233 RepID=A0ABR8SGZ6_9BACL|nr:radical SAM protein [Fictibacillus norfolkensis]MBD7962769.1 radical SAM protein [Fictibacillus norfolkensis]